MRRRLIVAVAMAAAGYACGDPAEPRIPTDIVIAAVDTVRSIGAQVTMGAVVRDQRQQPIAGTTITDWRSSDPSIATITDAGVLTAVANGATTITATSGTLSATTLVRVHQRVSNVTVTGPTGLASLGATAQLTAVARDQGGTDVVGRVTAWSSSNTSVVAIDPASGLATAAGPGSATINATIDGTIGSLALAVVQVPASLELTAPTDTLRALGASATYAIVVRDAGGSVIASPTLTWTSSNAAAVTVDGTGSATAVANGVAFVRVQAGTLLDSARLVVRQRADPAKSTVTLAHPLLLVSDTTTVTLVTRDARDNPLTISAGTVVFSTIGTPGSASTGSFLPTTDHDNGTYSSRWAAQGRGDGVAVTATINGAPVPVSPTLRVVGFTKIGTYGNPLAMSCGIITTGDMYCWGAREQGLRGTGVTVANVSETTPTLVGGSRQWVSLDLGLAAVCGIASDQKLYCWGETSQGALANGQNGGTVSTPGITVPDSNFMRVDLGQSRGSCALTAGHRALCWGGGTWGSLGNGADTAVLTPVAVNGGHQFAAIASSYSGACGVTDAGAALCWGIFSTLGIGNGPYPDSCLSACSKNPVPVVGGLTFKPIIAKDGNDVCAVTTGDKTYCWGRFNYTPLEKAGVPALTRLDAGYGDFCGIDTNGGIWCWGNNSAGRMQLPPDVAVEVNTPVNVATGRTYADLSMTDKHMCAIANDGNAWCWGLNDRGQLGDRTTVTSYMPVRVRLFVP